MKYFDTVRQKLRRKIAILPAYPNFFDTRNYCNSKGFLYGNFRHCETKNFRRKILKLSPPPLLSINFFATGNFLKHSTEGFTYQFFRHCKTKKFRQKIENRDITSEAQNFSIPEINETLKGSPLRKFSAL